MRELRALGMQHRVFVSGDSAAKAFAVARALGIEAVNGDLVPANKVAIERAR
ncbi:MAG: hypothetical protein ABIT38_15310 [Gemmatimonadaceae bacterium]